MRLAGALRGDDWGDEGDVFLLFRKKEGTEEKPILSFSRLGYFHSIHLVPVFFIREAARDYRFTLLTYAEPAAILFCRWLLLITRFVILSVLGYRAPGFLV